MTSLKPIDRAWREAHPLPVHAPGTDKNSRGRVLIVGGSALVAGAVRLPAEAALRVGAGKVRIATAEALAIPLAVTLPEAAVIGLPQDQCGEISGDLEKLRNSLANCDTILIGPGMSPRDETEALLKDLLASPRPGLSLVLDAAAVSCASRLAPLIASHGGRVIMTPHFGEMAALKGIAETAVAQSPEKIALEVAAQFTATVVLKSHRTLIAQPDGLLLSYESDCVGLATGGSGDVLAGAIAGLLSRGADPLTAAGWGVWLHGESGKAAASRIGPLGFLARELACEFPRLMVHDQHCG